MAPRTSVTGSSSWPTPTADVCIGIAPTEAMAERFRRKGSNGSFVEAGSAKILWPTPVARDWKGEGFDGQLPNAVRAAGPNSDGMWPTPVADGDRATDYAQGGMSLGRAARMWPTPKASPSGPDYAKATRPGSGADDLATSVAREEGGGALNPTWVEWLMGFPIGWTDCAA